MASQIGALGNRVFRRTVEGRWFWGDALGNYTCKKGKAGLEQRPTIQLRPRPLSILQEVLERGWLSKLSHMRQDARTWNQVLAFWKGEALYKALLCGQGQSPVRDTAVSHQYPRCPASTGDPNLLVVFYSCTESLFN